MRLGSPSPTERRDEPRPFSSEWLQAPPQEITRPRLPVLPAWVPGDHVVRAGLVLLLVLGTALVGAGGGGRGDRRLAARDQGTEQISAGGAIDTVTPEAMVPTTIAEQTVARAINRTAPTPTPTFAASPPTPTPKQGGIGAAATLPPDLVNTSTDGLLPRYRILTYYGHPHNDSMGLLGQHDPVQLLQMLREQADAYEAVDPTRPVIIAFEVVASVAQAEPQFDGTYLLHTDLDTLNEYADIAAANNALLFLDLQIGRSTVAADMDGIMPLLQRPNVHLALDPEFSMVEGQTPGVHIGSVTAEQIAYAQETLAGLVSQLGLPPKILIVHQFREDMIQNKMDLAPVPGVQLVIDADGYGDPVLKTDVYNYLVRDEFIEFGGIKLFYDQDKPLMTPEDVLALEPSPDLIIYQ